MKIEDPNKQSEKSWKKSQWEGSCYTEKRRRKQWDL